MMSFAVLWQSASELLLTRLRALPDYDRVSIVFPDDGDANSIA